MPAEVKISIGDLLLLAGRRLDMAFQRDAPNLLLSHIAWRHAGDGESIIIYEPGTYRPPAFAPNEPKPSGWVGSSGTRGGEGRVVVLSYPPVNGTFTATIGSHTSTLDWRDGVTLTDALAE